MSEVITVIQATKKVDRPRSEIQVIEEALKHNAIQNALSNVSDDVMTTEEYDKETQKAVSILENAIFQILGECELYGDDAIIEVDNVSYPSRYSCKSFIDGAVSTAIENVNAQIN